MSLSRIQAPLRLPEDFPYDCVQCGRGCSAFAEIPVDPESEERINQLDLDSLLPGEDRRPPVIDSPIVPGRRMMKHVRGHCCFLTLRKQCLIHLRYSKETKPQACQDFPFRFVETPLGDFAGLSFACTAVLEEQGPPVTAQAAQLEVQRHHAVSRRVVPPTVHLADRIPLRWDQYQQIEADLLEILDIELRPIENCLIAQNLYLRFLEEFVREAHSKGLAGEAPLPPAPPPSPAAAPAPTGEAVAGLGHEDAPPAAMLEGVLPPLALTDSIFSAFRAQMSQDGWSRLFILAAKPIESPMLYRSFVGQIVTFRQTLGREKLGRLMSVGLILATYFRHVCRLGGVVLTPLSRPLDRKEIRRTTVDFSDPFFAYTARRFFRHSIFRKDLLLESHLRSAHSFLLLYFGLWRLYTMGLTAIEGLEKAERRHLLEGLFNVEKFYVFHSSFNTLFRRYPWWRSSVESTMNAKTFPASMVRAAF